MNGPVGFVLNPGTGEIPGATEAHAESNMRHLLTDCNRKDLKFVRAPEHDKGEGRYSYLVYRDRGTRYHLVEMPGWSLDKVRYMEESQNAWHFPRLYVDGSSWLWVFALQQLNDADAFTEPHEWGEKE